MKTLPKKKSLIVKVQDWAHADLKICFKRIKELEFACKMALIRMETAQKSLRRSLTGEK